MDNVIDYLEAFGAKFVRCSNGNQVWEAPSMELAQMFIEDIEDAHAFNWCPIQQPNGPVGRNPQIFLKSE